MTVFEFLGELIVSNKSLSCVKKVHKSVKLNLVNPADTPSSALGCSVLSYLTLNETLMCL